MEEEIRAEFKRSGFMFDEEDQIVKKCLTFCVNYNLKPSDIVSSWEVYYFNKSPVVQTAQMDGFLQHLQNKKRKVVVKVEPDMHVYSSKDVNIDPKEDVQTPNGRFQNLHKEQFDSTSYTNGIIKKARPLRSFPMMVPGSGSGPETHCRFMNDRIDDRFSAPDNRIMKHAKALVVSEVNPTVVSQ